MQIVIWSKLTPNEKVKLLTRSLEDNESQKVESKVKEMINEISTDGEKALFKYEKMFGNNSKTFLVSELEMTEGNKISAIQKRSIKYAYNNIKQFYGKQVPKKVVIKNKFKTLEKVYVPITNVGLYIPGGTCPLVSTILMTGTLAQIAKCKNVVMCTPTDKDGNINQAILYAAKLVGINKIFKIGGVQAICAMGYGIGGVPKVNKIFGPGNQWVTEAKKQLGQNVPGLAIDMPAGPSEVMVVADSSANPSFVAADLLAQTEHIGGRGILLTNSLKLAKEVEKNLKEQIPNLSAQSQTFISQNKIDLVVVKDIAQALDIANDYAPEHLMLEVVKPQYWKTKVVNAGSVFLGNYSSEALGDYVSGTNHVLPTNQYAKCYSGLCTEAFMKSITFSNITKAGILDMKNATATLADLESLDAHKQSVLIRCEQIKNQKEKK